MLVPFLFPRPGFEADALSGPGGIDNSIESQVVHGSSGPTFLGET